MNETNCACSNCTCPVSGANAVDKDGKSYCSKACAEGHPDGKGCCNSNCNCG